MYIVSMPVADYSYTYNPSSQTNRENYPLEIFDTDDLSTTIMSSHTLLYAIVNENIGLYRFPKDTVYIEVSAYISDKYRNKERSALYYTQHSSNSAIPIKKEFDFTKSFEENKTVCKLKELCKNSFWLKYVTDSTLRKYKKNSIKIQIQNEINGELVDVYLAPSLHIKPMFEEWDISRKREDYYFNHCVNKCITEKQIMMWLARGEGSRGSAKVILMLNINNHQFAIDFLSTKREGILRYRTKDNTEWGKREIVDIGSLEQKEFRSGYYALFSGIGRDMQTNRFYLLYTKGYITMYDKDLRVEQIRVYLDEIEWYPYKLASIVMEHSLGGVPLYKINPFDTGYRLQNNTY